MANKKKSFTIKPGRKPFASKKPYDRDKPDYPDELDSEEVIDPDEGKYKDELRMGIPDYVDPMFDDEKIERRSDRSNKDFKVDRD